MYVSLWRVKFSNKPDLFTTIISVEIQELKFIFSQNLSFFRILEFFKLLMIVRFMTDLILKML